MEQNRFKMEDKILKFWSDFMITKKELQEYSKISGLNLGQAEKDYFQNIILFIIYRDYGKNMIFKGGTALKKCYGLNRFSEDLDFTSPVSFEVAKVENGLKRFGIEFEKHEKMNEGSLKITLKIKGPLYIGIRQSLCSIIIDLSFRENVKLSPEIKTIGRFLKEIPSFDVFVMQEKEILAEKIRTIITRSKARDVYDLWFLAKKGISFDISLISEKLRYYDEKWDEQKFAIKIEEKESLWISELSSLIDRVPDFDLVKNEILQMDLEN